LRDNLKIDQGQEQKQVRDDERQLEVSGSQVKKKKSFLVMSKTATKIK